MVGRNWTGGTVTACYSTGAVSGGTYNGGVVGINDVGGYVYACYWSGQVDGGNGIGYPPSDDTTTQVTGNVTWDMAVNGAEGLTGMNAAILKWNSNNPGNPCNYHYDDSKAPPELAPGAPASTTTP